MRRKIVISTMISTPLVATLLVSALSPSELSTSSCCKERNAYINSLPMSHPDNQCATGAQKASNKSWLSWISGRSRSPQFHFYDLLELLSKQRQDKVPAER